MNYLVLNIRGGGSDAITSNVDWNTITESGWYIVCCENGTINGPSLYLYGILVVYNWHRHCCQIYYSHYVNTYAIATRFKWNGGDFLAWRNIKEDKE